MVNKVKIIITREKVPDSELQSVQKIPGDQVCVVYLGGNGTVERKRLDGSVATARENANGNAKYVRSEITEPLFANEIGITVPVYSIGYDFDDMDTGGSVTMRGDNKKHTVKNALQYSTNSDGYRNYLVINNRNIRRILKNDISKYDLDTISSKGYVLDTLEATLWVLFNTDSYNQAIIGAINLGNDTDTVGACVGGLAGIYYGFDKINELWIKDILKYDYIIGLCEKFDEVLKK